VQITTKSTGDVETTNDKKDHNEEINNFENKRFEKSELMHSDTRSSPSSYVKTTANFDNAINDIKKILVLVLEQAIEDADKDSNSIIEQITSRRRNISNLAEELKKETVSNDREEKRTSVEVWQPVEVFKKAHYLKNRLHSLNERSEIDQIQLQRMLDNYSKIMSMIDEIMRKICQIEDSIIGNIK
jgi:hypothetical protein